MIDLASGIITELINFWGRGKLISHVLAPTTPSKS